MSKMSIDKLHIDELRKRLKNNSAISVDDFQEFYKNIYGEINRNTVRWYISELKKRSVIRNISRGHYVFEEGIKDRGSDYVVITLDIIKSSEFNYSEFNVELKNKVNELNLVINEIYDYDRKYFISQGDEIQILCPFDDRLSSLIMLTIGYLRPFKIRYGVSFGVIDDEIRTNSWEMNGPIFWNARDQLTEQKNSKEYTGLFVSEYNQVDKICNKTLSLINKAINRISDKQWDAIKFELSKVNTEKVLRELNISKTSYYDRLNVSNLDEIISSFGAILEIMKKRRQIE